MKDMKYIKRQRIPNGQPKIDNSEKLARQRPQDEGKQNKNTTQSLYTHKHK